MFKKLGALALGTAVLGSPVALANSAHAANVPQTFQCNKVVTTKYAGVTYVAPAYVSQKINHGLPNGCVIAYGSRGAYVTALQQEVNIFARQNHTAQVPVTGYFGDMTKNAISGIQKKVGARVNGQMNMETASILIEPFIWSSVQ